MARPTSPVADRRALASALRSLREDAGLSLEQAAAEALDASGAKLSRIETAKQVAGPRDVRDLCQLYGASSEATAQLISWSATAREPGWWESFAVNDDDFVGLESAATRIDEFAASFVPGLLQTHDYAAAFVATMISPGRTRAWSKREINEWLEIRERRQQILEPPSGVELSFVLDEAAIRRAVGQHMRAQIEHLAQIAEQPNVDLRVLPFSAGASPGQRGSFIVLTLIDGPDVAYVETQAGFLLIDAPSELQRFKKLTQSVKADSYDLHGTRIALARILTETQ